MVKRRLSLLSDTGVQNTAGGESDAGVQHTAGGDKAPAE